ncbi:hypothetical protein B566_EDAN000810 [Ephemera danica]|nr:hypothetical protein B566_EDAN000810 [Ephemera danica]
MDPITCEIPSVEVSNNNYHSKPRVVSVSPWLDENKKTSSSSIQLESSESRGYVVSIILNSEPSQQEVPVQHDGGATTVLHVSGPSAAGSCSGDGRQRNSYNVGRVSGSCIKISLGGISEEASQVTTTTNDMVRPGHFFYFPDAQLSGGLSSPSDTNDSGAGSDFDGSTPPPLPKRKQQASPVDSGVSSVTTHRSEGSLLTDEEEDSISCDSLNSSELNGDSIIHPPSPPELIDTILPGKFKLEEQIRSLQLHEEKVLPPPPPPVIVSERTYAERSIVPPVPQAVPDHHYEFHLHENVDREGEDVVTDTFAGVRDVLGERGAIKSARGTVRGVKNRVRAGIATFLQLEDTKVSI